MDEKPASLQFLWQDDRFMPIRLLTFAFPCVFLLSLSLSREGNLVLSGIETRFRET